MGSYSGDGELFFRGCPKGVVNRGNAIIYAYYRLVFRGRHDDYPVLCSDTRTYSVKEAETSNSLLLIPNLSLKNDLNHDLVGSKGNRVVEFRKVECERQNQLAVFGCDVYYFHRCLLQVAGMTSKYLELKPIMKFKSARLRELLEDCPYYGRESDENSSETKKLCARFLKIVFLLCLKRATFSYIIIIIIVAGARLTIF
ncbi:MAG: DUF2036 domain-containing protein [Gammaproteobacteria bacterium]|nr:DUF2036 domain-containing protein [Gammaproteobacteria bacterium]